MTGAGPGVGVPGGDVHAGGGAHAGRCVTCADAAEWMRVVEIDAGNETARCVDAHAHSETVATELVGAVARGDALLVHAGVAIHRDARSTAPEDTADG